jgi:phosphatidylinositol-3-phosphatase
MRTRLLAVAAALPLLAGSPAAVSAATAARPAPAAASGPCGTLSPAPAYTHVIWIWLENHSLDKIIGSAQAPYLNSLATACGLATNYHNITHKSLPNYVGATSGLGYQALARFTGDCSPLPGCTTTAPSIFGQGETWKAYQESMPSNCDTKNSGEYAVHHNPVPYFTKLPGCATSDVPYTELAHDLTAGTLPAFSFITPNLLDDMHTGTIAEGDRWMAANLPKILDSDEYTDGSTAVFITWDEGHGGTPGEKCATNKTDDSCHIATIVISPSTKPGTRSATLFNHYSLLRTAEELLGLPLLGNAAGAASMVPAFGL